MFLFNKKRIKEEKKTDLDEQFMRSNVSTNTVTCTQIKILKQSKVSNLTARCILLDIKTTWGNIDTLQAVKYSFGKKKERLQLSVPISRNKNQLSPASKKVYSKIADFIQDALNGKCAVCLYQAQPGIQLLCDALSKLGLSGNIHYVDIKEQCKIYLKDLKHDDLKSVAAYLKVSPDKSDLEDILMPFIHDVMKQLKRAQNVRAWNQLLFQKARFKQDHQFYMLAKADIELGERLCRALEHDDRLASILLHNGQIQDAYPYYFEAMDALDADVSNLEKTIYDHQNKEHWYTNETYEAHIRQKLQLPENTKTIKNVISTIKNYMPLDSQLPDVNAASFSQQEPRWALKNDDADMLMNTLIAKYKTLAQKIQFLIKHKQDCIAAFTADVWTMIKGSNAEKTVFNYLQQYVSGGWQFIPNANIPIVSSKDNSFENDEIIITNNGIFTVEIKSWSKGIKVARDGFVEGEKNPIEQSTMHEAYLTQFLYHHLSDTGIDFNNAVHGIIVFLSNDNNIINESDYPIIRYYLLRQEILKYAPCLSNDQVSRITQTIKKHLNQDKLFPRTDYLSVLDQYAALENNMALFHVINAFNRMTDSILGKGIFIYGDENGRNDEELYDVFYDTYLTSEDITNLVMH